MNYKNMAKRNLQLYEDFIPVIDRVFELYSAYDGEEHHPYQRERV